MSSTNRSDVRIDKDFYETPAWCMQAIAPRLLELCPKPSTILEPGAGHGAIVRELRVIYGSEPAITAVEIRPEAEKHLDAAGADEVLIEDFLAYQHSGPRYDLAVINPPYTYAMEFVELTLEVASITVCLLPLGFLSSQKRSTWMQSNTPEVSVLSRRPSFTGTGTDSTVYGWFIWGGPEQGKLDILGGDVAAAVTRDRPHLIYTSRSAP